VSFTPHFYDAVPLMTVGKVFDDSPASVAGLKKADLIVVFGALRIAGEKPSRAFKSDAERHMDVIEHFESIAETLKPIVASAADSHGQNIADIDVVVIREGAGHVHLRLRPGKWSGDGLIGAKVSAIQQDAPKKKTPVPNH
jgi:hypothetical protein